MTIRTGFSFWLSFGANKPRKHDEHPIGALPDHDDDLGDVVYDPKAVGWSDGRDA